MKISTRQIFFLSIAFFLPIWVFAQPKCKVEYYSTEQGLSHQRITTMLKDQQGFMWFGSWDGLNRFDGRSFVAYKSKPGDSSKLSSDRIQDIVEDRDGHLWIRSYDRQVYRFDKKTEQFETLPGITYEKQKQLFSKILVASPAAVWLQPAEGGLVCILQKNPPGHNYIFYKKGPANHTNLPSNTINFCYEDSSNHVWIGTAEGLCCLEQSAGGLFKNSTALPATIAPGENILAFEEYGENIYFITREGKLVSVNKRSMTLSVNRIIDGHLNAFLHSKRNNCIYFTTAEGELVTYQVSDNQLSAVSYQKGKPMYHIFEDRKGNLWIEPQHNGAILYKPISNSFEHFSEKSYGDPTTIGKYFWVIEDSNGFLWVHLKDGGLGYYNEIKGSIDYSLKTADGSDFRLPDISNTVFYDKAGVLWLTTYDKELVKIILQHNSFKQQIITEPSLFHADNDVRGIFYDNRNRLWLGIKSGKTIVYQNNKIVSGLFDNEPVQGLGLVYTITQDSKGNIWLGTKGNGLYKAIPLNKEETKYHLTHFVHNDKDTNSITGNDLYSLLEDWRGRIWVGTFDAGLNLVQEEGASVKFIHDKAALQHYPKDTYHKIRHLAEDANGNIFVGTTDGLVVIDPNSLPAFACKTYSKIPNDRESLGNNNIQFVLRDSKDRMWLGTAGGGLCLAGGNDPMRTLKFKSYTKSEGMPNDCALSLAEDHNRNIWIATENGLAMFNPENNTFRNYDSYSGLPKLPFSEASACRALPNGQLVFGTGKGFLSFDPDHINGQPVPANIAFTNLQVNNKDAGPGVDKNILEENINDVSGLSLKYNQNIISIDYAILDYRSGSQQDFAYRLLGFDTMWHDDRQQGRATYTNLPPGDYVFEVKSLSSGIYSNDPYRRLSITILPPPWKTWWAYLIYAACIVMILYFIRRYALAMIRLRQKIAIERRLAEIKMNFFTNISHELRTPLTLIVDPLDQLLKKEQLSHSGQAYVEVARKNAGRMVRFINQLLDLRKIQSNKASLHISRIEVVAFVKMIAEHFTTAAQSKNIELSVQSSEKELTGWADADKLDVVIYNLLGNALKFSAKETKVKVNIQFLPDEQWYMISVSDQGPGVPKEKLEDIFELFHEGDHTHDRAMKGTGIGLALAKELIQLHGGKIWAENNPGGGLTVTLKMKLGSAHYKPEQVDFAGPATTWGRTESITTAGINTSSFSKTPPGSPEFPLVLLVEDNDELREFIGNELGGHYRVEVAADGEEGLRKAITLMPDLVISDIMMPKMDGIQMLDRIKNDIGTSHIPVVLLSAKYSIESQIEGLRYGADYYITKPFNTDFLVAALDNLILQRRKLFQLLLDKKKTFPSSPEQPLITEKDENFLKEVISIVEERMTDIDFNIEAVAGSMAMSRTSFFKKFKSLTGQAPVEFVRDMRLQKAKQYLDAGEKNISQAAYQAGFSSPKYFSTCFKEKYQLSPSEYLKERANT